MKTEFQEGETLLREGMANLQRGWETVGGKLYLTSERLIFESHRFNIQTGTTSISLKDVVSVRKCWTRLFGSLPLFPNSLAVETKNGKSAQIVLWGRTAWINAIESSRRQHAAA